MGSSLILFRVKWGGQIRVKSGEVGVKSGSSRGHFWVNIGQNEVKLGSSLILLAINSVLSRGSSQGQVGVKLVLSQGQVGVTLGSFLGQYWSN